MVCIFNQLPMLTTVTAGAWVTPFDLPTTVVATEVQNTVEWLTLN